MRNIKANNIITMNLKKIQIGLNRLACSRYSEFDEDVINNASAWGLPLIGGTALEVLGAHFNKSGFRKRSDNDLDFASNDKDAISEFSAWLKANVDPSKVKVDVMSINSHKLPADHILNLGGVLVMSPEYIIWSKTKRFLERDIIDIKWLLPIADFDKLETLIETLGFTEKNLQDLNGLIDEVSAQIKDSEVNVNQGCLMLALDLPFMKELQDFIDPEDLHEYGLEDQPHVTVIYGANVESFPDFDSLGVALSATDVGVLFTGLSFFKNDKFDVMKFEVHSEALCKLYADLTARVPITSTFTEYVPHSTVAYLKPGSADKYRSLVQEFLTTHKVPVRVSPIEWIYSTGGFR